MGEQRFEGRNAESGEGVCEDGVEFREDEEVEHGLVRYDDISPLLRRTSDVDVERWTYPSNHEDHSLCRPDLLEDWLVEVVPLSLLFRSRRIRIPGYNIPAVQRDKHEGDSENRVSKEDRHDGGRQQQCAVKGSQLRTTLH